MRTLRALIVSSLIGSAALAQAAKPLIDRPVTLPQGGVDLTLHGTYTNWATGVTADVGPTSLTGETLAFGIDFAATDRAQLGVAVALPINPGAGFGSIIGSTAIAVGRNAGVRLDVGYERVGFNGDGTAGLNHIDRFLGGVGAPLQVPLSRTVAFVSGKAGAVEFGHFNNIGESGTGLYLGASFLPQGASDFFVISGGNNDSGTAIGINLPVGLLLQPDPAFALTLFAGYSAAITIPSSATGGSTQVLHFIPVGLEAIVTPVRALDIGLRVFFDGYVAQSNASSNVVAGGPGYFDLRAVMLWFRVHAT